MAKTSINIKPCLVRSSGPHNRRLTEYLANIRKEKFYIRTDLMVQNEMWVAPEIGDTSLIDYYNQIAAMVKEKTGRAMQTKDRERVNKKTGKVTIVRGSTPLKEGVVVIKEDTTMEQLRRFCEVCKERWGITPLQVFIHRDEGHYANPGDTATWKPNLHAHIVWDWMNHDTGKSCKLDEHDMSRMQTVLAECLEMERGISKKMTGKEHLERTDFIIAKQKEEMKRLDATRQYREHQLEITNRKMQEAESITNSLVEKAHQKERQSKDLDRAISEKRSKLNKEKGSELLNAAVDWATGKSKAMKNEIEDLRCEIATHEETIERLQCKIQAMQNDHHRERMELEAKHLSELNRREAAHTEETTRLKNRISWQNHIIGCFSFLLLKTSGIFRKAVHSVIRFARDYYKPRLNMEQVSDIKSALNLFGDDKQSHRAAGDFLYITAMQKGKLDNGSKSKPDGKSIT